MKMLFRSLDFFLIHISPEQLCSIVRASVIFFFFNRKLELKSHVLCFRVTLLLSPLKVGFMALVLTMFVFVVNFHRNTERV